MTKPIVTEQQIQAAREILERTACADLARGSRHLRGDGRAKVTLGSVPRKR